ncbi:hypothetical protein DID77_03665 [Candidatus Marinamargulisbacteria bacterium SCGC AG-439-L15]|nr:hypothetical protein DID77_03665 [Candidatus Marinamargulisbacteria bacterium SCGC AG-439-L15]
MKKRMMKIGLLTLCMVSMVFLQGAKKEDVLARVGRKKITTEDLANRLNQFPIQSREFLNKKENKVRVLDQLVDEELLFQRAKKLRMHRKKDYKAQLAQTKRQLLISFLIKEKVDNQTTVTEEEIKSYYRANPEEFAAREARNLSHILVKTRKQANRVNALLKKGRSFKSLAKKYSIDPSKENGGSLGWVEKEQVVPAFGKVAFRISKKGRRSGIVKTKFGYHIIKLNDIRVTPKQTFEAAKDQVKQQLMIRKRQDLFKTILSEAREKIKIKKNIDNLK